MMLEDFYKRSKYKLIKKIMPIVKSRDLAEDLFHDAIVRALERYESYDPLRSKIDTWFTHILFSIVWNWKRSYKKNIVVSLEDMGDFLDESISFYEAEKGKILSPVKNSSHKRIFFLRYVQGYTVTEIATLLNIFPETVKKALQRTKKEVLDARIRL